MASPLLLSLLLLSLLLLSSSLPPPSSAPWSLPPQPPVIIPAIPTPPAVPPPPAAVPPPPPAVPPPPQTTLLAPILGNLGFQELSVAVSALSPQPHSSLTLFAPSDDSIRSCPSCSPSALLREHLVPGLFPFSHLSRLAFGTKLQTVSPSRCLTITSTATFHTNSSVKIFVDGVEITRPDLFNDGRLIIHGLQGFVSALSPLSCSHDTLLQPQPQTQPQPLSSPSSSSSILRLMLRDAIVRLRDSGYSILSLAMRVKYSELAALQNMTIFALDDSAIFAGGHAYVTSVRFHVVPNRLLMHGDLARLPAGSTLPTLIRGQDLVVTHAGGGDPFGMGLRINYVPIRRGDIVYNVKVAVHSIFLPFPHLQPSDLALAASVAAAEDGLFGPVFPSPHSVPPTGHAVSIDDHDNL